MSDPLVTSYASFECAATICYRPQPRVVRMDIRYVGEQLI